MTTKIRKCDLYNTPNSMEVVTQVVERMPKDQQWIGFTIMYQTWNYLAEQVNEELRCEEQFPDFKLKVVIPDGFEDTSWHHDECPSWTNEELNLRIWIDPSPQQPSHRFGLADTYECRDILDTADWYELCEYVEEHRKNAQPISI